MDSNHDGSHMHEEFEDSKPRALSHSGNSLGSLLDHVSHSHIVSQEVDDDGVTMVAKFAKERITLENLDPGTTIGQVKVLLQEQTRVLPKRQKLIGLIAIQGGSKGVTDELCLSGLKVKGKVARTHEFILMGTPEEEIFVDPSDRDDLPDVIDDFDLDFNAGSNEWIRHVANGINLKAFTEKTEIFIMHPTRSGKPLLVLDLDHTLLDFSSKRLMQSSASAASVAARMKRPHMDEFLTQSYVYYDLAVWSQTSWRWLETKLTELGMLTHPGYKFCFVLDKTSMFTVDSQRRNGTHVKHHVKPLQIIWSKLPQYNSSNTVHIDDLSRNFALNLTSGIQCTAYHRKKARQPDTELFALMHYLKLLAEANVNFDCVDFSQWRAVCEGTKHFLDTITLEDDKKIKEEENA